jgi:hypothetical protein
MQVMQGLTPASFRKSANNLKFKAFCQQNVLRHWKNGPDTLYLVSFFPDN